MNKRTTLVFILGFAVFTVALAWLAIFDRMYPLDWFDTVLTATLVPVVLGMTFLFVFEVRSLQKTRAKGEMPEHALRLALKIGGIVIATVAVLGVAVHFLVELGPRRASSAVLVSSAFVLVPTGLMVLLLEWVSRHHRSGSDESRTG